MTIISDCGKYRYTLTRQIPCVLRWVKPLLFVMLNPSKADATIDDKTIIKCTKYAKSWYHTSLTVVNLFAYRATNPKELLKVEDPIGPENDRYIKEEVEKHILTGGTVIVGWGNNKLVAPRAKQFFETIISPDKVQCFKINKSGTPKHPLYCRDNAEPIPFELKHL